ncbi:hypothetical protein [Flavobacterium psychrophilum]|uniref:Uncharacterized protein n=1 Tax=Flavobacterium psychrophilum TaxID=96345 RepID=A0A7U2NEH6_FLAPS|nr:hypothetical protein [Flavobacterium psychrophilum]QRE03549.1 hypothetical protein H0H26_11765 [Flavobacterium psychrophilum]
MRKIIVFGFLLLSNLFFSQEHKSLKEVNQYFFQKCIPVFLKNTENLSFNSYFKEGELYITCEYNSDVAYNESIEIEEFTNRSSRDFIYNRMANFLTTNNGKLLKNYENEMGSNYINFSFIIKTSDFKSWINNYFVSVADLYKISPYYNRDDFYLILKSK